MEKLRPSSECPRCGYGIAAGSTQQLYRKEIALRVVIRHPEQGRRFVSHLCLFLR